MYFKYDLKIGLKKTIPWFLVVATIVVMTSIELNLRILTNEKEGLEMLRSTNSMDYFLNVFAGLKPFNITENDKFQLPITWFLIHMILFYFTGKYPYSEIYNNHGANVLMRGGSRNKWFLSKWLWSMVCVMIYYFVAYIFVLLFCMVVQIPISFEVQPIDYEELLSPMIECTMLDTVELIILPIISSMAAVSIQLVISLILNPLLGFMFMASLYISSAYYFTPLLIGNCSMFARNGVFYMEGITFSQTIIVSLITMLLSMLIGIFVFYRRDIIGRK